MLASRLVQLIESHSERLSEELLNKFFTTERCSDMLKVPPAELRSRSHEIYRNLSDWLLAKTEPEIEARYLQIGRDRYRQGVALSHFICAINLTREHVHEFLRRETFSDNSLELFGHLELVRMLDQFFDKVVYYTAVGYEREAQRNGRAA